MWNVLEEPHAPTHLLFCRMATFPSRQQKDSFSSDSSRALQWEHWCSCPRWMAAGFGQLNTGRRLHSGVEACCGVCLTRAVLLARVLASRVAALSPWLCLARAVLIARVWASRVAALSHGTNSTSVEKPIRKVGRRVDLKMQRVLIRTVYYHELSLDYTNAKCSTFTDI